MDVVLVTVCNQGYNRWLNNLRQNLIFFNLADRLHVCREHGNSTALTFGTRCYFALLHRRQQCYWRLVHTRPPNTYVLVIDADVTLFRNPITALEALPSAMRSADLVALDDTGPYRKPGYSNFDYYLNCGFLLLHNTPATVALGRAFRSALARHPGTNDQEVFNSVVWNRSRTNNLKVGVLPSSQFMNGYRFYEAPTNPRVDPSAIVAVHHNWVRGDHRKWKRAVKYQTLIANVNESYNAFWQRAHAAMNMPAWNWRH